MTASSHRLPSFVGFTCVGFAVALAHAQSVRYVDVDATGPTHDGPAYYNMPAPAPDAIAERAVRDSRTNNAAAREYASLAARIDKNLKIGRVVNVQPPLLKAPPVPSRLLDAFPNADPDLFETTPVGVPIITFEIPNNEAIEAGLVDSRGSVETGGSGEAYVFNQPNDSGFGWYMKDDDVAGCGGESASP